MTAWPPAAIEERIGHTPRRRLGETPGQYVRRMRHALDRSIDDVAADAGISRTLVHAIETGQKRITEAVALELADALGFDAGEVLGVA